MIGLSRTPLLMERTRPSIGLHPKARTRHISVGHQLGGSRRSLYQRLERRTRDGATPQHREVARSLARIRHVRRKNDILPLHGKRKLGQLMSKMGRRSVRSSLLRGSRL